MTRITDNQKETIVRLFRLGTSIADLAISYQVSAKRIEDIIRVALKTQDAPTLMEAEMQ